MGQELGGLDPSGRSALALALRSRRRVSACGPWNSGLGVFQSQGTEVREEPSQQQCLVCFLGVREGVRATG